MQEEKVVFRLLAVRDSSVGDTYLTLAVLEVYGRTVAGEIEELSRPAQFAQLFSAVMCL